MVSDLKSKEIKLLKSLKSLKDLKGSKAVEGLSGLTGLKDAIPVIVAYFPLAMTFGVLAVASGLSSILTIFSSIWIYSGGGQFMLVSMASALVAPITMIVTILLVNLRHVLYGTTLGPHMKKWSVKAKLIAALGLTDEVFALIASKVRQEGKLHFSYYIVFAMSCYGSWILGTMAGVLIGSFVPTELTNILSFTLPALFLALLFMGEKTIAYLLSAGVGAVVAILMNKIGLGSIGLILGAVLGATSGFIYNQKRKQTINTSQQAIPLD
jgi:4-azaleucine resistance transporter AzlC